MVASLAVEHRFQEHGLQLLQHLSSVVVAPELMLLSGMRYLPRPGIEPGSHALAGVLLAAVPPRKSWHIIFQSLQIPT